MKVKIGYDRHNDPEAWEIDPSAAKPTDQAYPTSRLLDGSTDHGYAEEWAEPAMLPDGRKCLIMYLFDDDDITWDDGEPREAEDYPWNNEHVSWIKLIEE